MVPVPAQTGVITPVAGSIGAHGKLLQTPPKMPHDIVAVVPTQTLEGPDNAPGKAFTVTITVAEHPDIV